MMGTKLVEFKGHFRTFFLRSNLEKHLVISSQGKGKPENYEKEGSVMQPRGDTRTGKCKYLLQEWK